jgi:hypothetical protein
MVSVTGFDYVASSQSGTFQLTVTAIPEPAICAAVFGLGAMGFAAYRRRRRQAG